MEQSLQPINIKLFDMVLCFSRAIELLHPAISDHHLRVAYIGSCLAEQLGLDAAKTQDILIAGALHDVAAVSSVVWLALLDEALAQYHSTDGQLPEDLHRHGFEGYLLMRDFPPFAAAAEAIRFHHVDWQFGRGSELAGQAVPIASHILHLADRVAVLPQDGRNVLEQVSGMQRTIASGSGALFQPEIVAAFEAISARESFWLDLVSPHKEEIVQGRFGSTNVNLDLDGLYELAKVFGKIIDYRSPFTAAHSSAVAATAEALAGQMGISLHQRRLIGVAGYLHDIGKLAVPPEILDKPGKLTADEMFIIKQHPYYTHRILSMVSGLETVNLWASLHHERLDGTGYPFRPGEIPLGSRLIAVADIFTALTENRPYRQGMDRAQSMAVLDRLVAERAIDGEIVSVLRRNFDALHHVRHGARRPSLHEVEPLMVNPGFGLLGAT
jgi:HD-GYP domain-containing protein (c-di-GMP phosphodiesterase class II)